MGLDFDVFEFCKKLRQNRPPPYQCPLEKCDKVYKSLCGLQYHLVNYDHDNPTPVTPAVANHRKKGRVRAAVPTGDIALQSPPKEALTFAEAQKVVQFEIDGKISRIPIDQPLPVMSLVEWEKKNSELEKPLPIVEPPSEPHVKLPEASFKVIIILYFFFIRYQLKVYISEYIYFYILFLFNDYLVATLLDIIPKQQLLSPELL